MESAEWVLCLGVYGEELIVSIRTRRREGGAGQLAQAIVGDQGAAGGHGAMAGGHIPLWGRQPKAVATRLNQRALRHLNIPTDHKGQPLV